MRAIKYWFFPLAFLLLVGCTCDDKWANQLKGKQIVRKMGERTFGSPVSGFFFLGSGSINGGGSEPAVTFFWEIKSPDMFVATTIPLSKTTIRIIKGKKIPDIEFIFRDICTSNDSYQSYQNYVKKAVSSGFLYGTFVNNIKNLVIETSPEHWPVQITLPMNKP